MSRAGVGGLLLAAVCVAVGCTSAAVERQHLADGSWHFTCRLPMDECVRHVETICMDKRYRILSAQSKRELRDVDPGIRETRISDITAVCDREKPEPQLASSVAPAPASSPACVPGSTQACVGPGGCSGGQVCRPEGTGFGACDCGPAKAAAGDAGP